MQLICHPKTRAISRLREKASCRPTDSKDAGKKSQGGAAACTKDKAWLDFEFELKSRQQHTLSRKKSPSHRIKAHNPFD